jgi:predicted DCC family thiol-disulfide oxidoreductase YuxK
MESNVGEHLSLEGGDPMINTNLPKYEQSLSDTHAVVLFDGVCRFCNGWVQFLIKRDKADVFRFAPLQSDYAQSVLSLYKVDIAAMDSVIVVEGTKLYTHSSAVLRIVKRLGGGWSILSGLSLVPRRLRDEVYHWIAKRRYKLFGKYDSCMMPTENVRRKFLD